jgi:predicted hotdog family 3-hydroxylacyl-ACP dehydratase
VRLDRRWIALHLPHEGNMCLLEEVLAWDLRQIVCRAVSHRAGDNPLRAHGRLAAICAVEYAAQASALHGALQLHSVHADVSDEGAGRDRLAVDAGARFGLLASARAVELSVQALDQIVTDLLVRVRQLHTDGHGALYAFSIEDQAATSDGAEGRDLLALGSPRRALVQGRLSVLLDAARAASRRHGAASRAP